MNERDFPTTFSSTDYWFKVVEFLQQNWAVIEPRDEGVAIFFFGDDSGVFDLMEFPSERDAREGLMRNGFARIDADPESLALIGKPMPPFRRRRHPNGGIYSSGRFWH